MPIWSELLQGAARARGSYLGGKRAGDRQRLQDQIEQRRQDREDADSAATRAHLARLSALRDPNDPELIAERARLERENDLAVERERNRGSLTTELRRAMTSSQESIRNAQAKKSSAERAMRGLPSIYASPEAEAQGKATRDSLLGEIASADSAVAANQGEHTTAKQQLQKILGLPVQEAPRMKEQDPAYQAARQRAKDLYLKAIKNAAGDRQKILAAKQAYSEAVNEIKAEFANPR